MGKYKTRLESALKICRSGESLLRDSFSPVECKLIEKISKSLTYKQNQGSSAEVGFDDPLLGAPVYNNALGSANPKKNKACIIDRAINRLESLSTVNNDAKADKEQNYGRTQLVNKFTSALNENAARAAHCPLTFESQHFKRTENEPSKLNTARPSDMSFVFSSAQNSPVQSNLNDFNKPMNFVQISSLNFRLESAGGTQLQLSDARIAMNFSKLREIACSLRQRLLSN